MTLESPLAAPAVPDLPLVVGFAVLPALTALAASAAALAREPGAPARSVVQHFASGVVLAVVAGELLPDVTRAHQIAATTVGFAAGTLLTLFLQHVARRLERMEPPGHAAGGQARRRRGAPVGLLVTVGIDVLLDGLLLGVGFAAGARAGTLLAIGLSTELLSLGLAVTGALREAGLTRPRTLGAVAGLVVLVPVGAVGGSTVLQGASEQAMTGVLSFGSAALLYLVTEELLVAAHDVEETSVSTLAFATGFLALYLFVLAMT